MKCFQSKALSEKWRQENVNGPLRSEPGGGLGRMVFLPSSSRKPGTAFAQTHPFPETQQPHTLIDNFLDAVLGFVGGNPLDAFAANIPKSESHASRAFAIHGSRVDHVSCFSKICDARTPHCPSAVCRAWDTHARNTRPQTPPAVRA